MIALYREKKYFDRNKSLWRMIRNFVMGALIFCLLISCAKEKKIKQDILDIPVQVEIERFDQLFANVSPENLQELKDKFPYLFPKKYADSIWVAKSRDTIQLELHREIQQIFPDVLKEEEELTLLLKHIKYYFPEVTVPKVIAVTSDVDYRNKIVLANNLLLIALDTYLGEEHHFYQDIQVFLKKNFKREQIMPDIATMYAKQIVELPSDRTFLSNVLYYGKELYLKKLFLPRISEASIMAYTEEEFKWAIANEEQIWRYFIDKELLYSTDNSLSSRFLFPAPFSKFYLEQIDKEAPDRLGQYIGWRIISSYMKNNNVSLRQLVMTDAETIFNASRYKPSK